MTAAAVVVPAASWIELPQSAECSLTTTLGGASRAETLSLRRCLAGGQNAGLECAAGAWDCCNSIVWRRSTLCGIRDKKELLLMGLVGIEGASCCNCSQMHIHSVPRPKPWHTIPCIRCRRTSSTFFYLLGRFSALLFFPERSRILLLRQTLENRQHPFWPVCSPVTRPITYLRIIACSEHGCHADSGARTQGPRSQQQVEWPRPLGPPLLLPHRSECLARDLAGIPAVAAGAPRGSQGTWAVPLRHPTPACTLSSEQRTVCCSTA